jgi:NAD(P)-dependent dehydrogenase (short-subunit alcohol dehydrogenase family)
MHRGNHPDAAAAVAADVQAAGRRARIHVGDAGRFEHIEPAADQLLADAGPRSVHLLVHSLANASVGYLVHGAPKLHPKQINKTFESMTHSFVYWTRALVERDLFAPGGRVLALTNAVTESNLSNLSVIAASKAALEMYVKYMAWELGPLGLRVNALRFGTVETAALRHVFRPEVWDQVKDLHDQMFPAGRMNTLEEVAAFVAVLADDAGHWFNGAVIDFTGGQMHSLYQLMMDRLLAGQRGEP